MVNAENCDEKIDGGHAQTGVARLSGKITGLLPKERVGLEERHCLESAKQRRSLAPGSSN